MDSHLSLDCPVQSQGAPREKGEAARRLQIVHGSGDVVVTVVAGGVLVEGERRADLAQTGHICPREVAFCYL